MRKHFLVTFHSIQTIHFRFNNETIKLACNLNLKTMWAEGGGPGSKKRGG